MATGSSLDISPPDSWEQWETIVADLARRELGDPLAVKHGGENEGDVGVDAYARYGGSDRLVGLQAKNREKLDKTRMRKNVKRAREFEPELDYYVFVWTGERSTKVQQRVRDIDEMNREKGYFPVSLWTWDTVREMLARHPDLLDAHFPEYGERYSELKDGGFVRLSEAYFEDQFDQDLHDAWIAGLRPVDVREGYAIDRWMDVSGEEDESTWVSMTGELLRRLEHENIMVRGRPGSGKSTVCLSVANQWYEMGKGAVFYRPSGTPGKFPERSSFERAIEVAEGHVLFVVEDAVREETKEIHPVLYDLPHEESASFLLDGRYGEDREFDAGPADTNLGRQISYHDHVSYVDLGRLKEEECRQMIALYEAETGDYTGVDAKHLQQRLDTFGWAGDMLHVAYYLLLSDEKESELEADARGKFAYMRNPEANYVTRTQLRHHNQRLLMRSAVLLNLLNLAGLPLHREFVHALPEAIGEDHSPDEVDSLLDDALQGWLVFGKTDDTQLMGHHAYWSFHFLRYMLHGRQGDEEVPVRRCEVHRWIIDAVNAVVTMLDDPDRRSWLVDSGETEDGPAGSKKTKPEEIASKVLSSIFGVGRKWPSLAPLFGPVDNDAYAIRDAAVCPEWLEARTLALRADVLRKNVDLERQEREECAERAFKQALETLGDVRSERERKAETLVLDRYGTLHHARDEYEEAIERFERCLKLHTEIDNPAGEATTLNNLGEVHRARGEWDKAVEYYEHSLAIRREIGDRAGEAATLTNLGLIHRARGEWENAEEYYEHSLAIRREIGDRAGEAATLNNLGEVHRARGEWDKAEEYYEKSIAIER